MKVYAKHVYIVVMVVYCVYMYWKYEKMIIWNYIAVKTRSKSEPLY